jgi:hypothetical protein
MDRREQVLTALELEADLRDYYYDVDTNWGRRASEFHTADAVFDMGKTKLQGRDAIDKFFAWRRQRGTRTAVHIVANYRATFDGEGGATATWYMLIHAADGEPPLASRPPVGINRVTDQLRYDAEQERWLCNHRVLEPLFEGGAMLRLPNFGTHRGTTKWAAKSVIQLPI